MVTMIREPEVQGHAIFISDFVHLRTPLERHAGFAAEGTGATLQRALRQVASSIPMGPGSGLARWAARVVIKCRRACSLGSVVDAVWLATCEDSPVDEIDTVISLDAAGVDHARLGVEAVLRVRSGAKETDARWLGEELCRAILSALTLGELGALHSDLDGRRGVPSSSSTISTVTGW